MITLEGREVEYVERPSEGAAASGAPILFVPGSFATAAAWRPIQTHLPAERRQAAVALSGYGRTEERRMEADCGIEHAVAVIAAAAERLGEPFHAVGHSFGGSAVLAARFAGAIEPLSMTLFEPTTLEVLLLTGEEDLYRGMEAMVSDYAAALAAEEADTPRFPLDFWGGSGAFAALPEPVRAYCNATAPANLLDWRSGLGFRVGRAAFEGLETPLLAALGDRSPPTMAAIVRGLVALAPDARQADVAGATHFLISTHAEACAAALRDFIAKVEAR